MPNIFNRLSRRLRRARPCEWINACGDSGIRITVGRYFQSIVGIDLMELVKRESENYNQLPEEIKQSIDNYPTILQSLGLTPQVVTDRMLNKLGEIIQTTDNKEEIAKQLTEYEAKQYYLTSPYKSEGENEEINKQKRKEKIEHCTNIVNLGVLILGIYLATGGTAAPATGAIIAGAEAGFVQQLGTYLAAGALIAPAVSSACTLAIDA